MAELTVKGVFDFGHNMTFSKLRRNGGMPIPQWPIVVHMMERICPASSNLGAYVVTIPQWPSPGTHDEKTLFCALRP